MRVLIIEDESSIRENIEEMLELKGIETKAVQNGVQALRDLEEFNPSLILCDLMMPEMSGIEFLSHIKQDPRFSNIPLIFVSARAEVSEREKALELGAEDFITKPFAFKDIFTLIEKYS